MLKWVSFQFLVGFVPFFLSCKHDEWILMREFMNEANFSQWNIIAADFCNRSEEFARKGPAVLVAHTSIHVVTTLFWITLSFTLFKVLTVKLLIICFLIFDIFNDKLLCSIFKLTEWHLSRCRYLKWLIIHLRCFKCSTWKFLSGLFFNYLHLWYAWRYCWRYCWCFKHIIIVSIIIVIIIITIIYYYYYYYYCCCCWWWFNDLLAKKSVPSYCLLLRR